MQGVYDNVDFIRSPLHNCLFIISCRHHVKKLFNRLFRIIWILNIYVTLF